MIKRHYFYHLVLQDELKPQFANGILSVRSWFADPEKAWEYALDFVCDKWMCDRAKVRCEAFNIV